VAGSRKAVGEPTTVMCEACERPFLPPTWGRTFRRCDLCVAHGRPALVQPANDAPPSAQTSPADTEEGVPTPPSAASPVPPPDVPPDADPVALLEQQERAIFETARARAAWTRSQLQALEVAAQKEGRTPAQQRARIHQLADLYASPRLVYLETKALPAGLTPAEGVAVMADSGWLEAVDGLLYRQRDRRAGRLTRHEDLLFVVPDALHGEILYLHREDKIGGGHFDANSTYEKLAERYWWSGMRAMVMDWVHSCHWCQSRKGRRIPAVGGMQGHPVPQRPCEFVEVGAFGPLPTSKDGNVYIVTFTDVLTRYVEAVALPDQTADTVAKALVLSVVLRHGAPRRLMSDQGPAFIADVAKAVYELCNINKKFSTAYYPQANAVVERFNHTLAQMLSMYVLHHDEWDIQLPYVVFAYNSRCHRSTQETPFFLMYGRMPWRPVDVELGAKLDKYRFYDDYRSELVRGLELMHKAAFDTSGRAQRSRLRQQAKVNAAVAYREGEEVLRYRPAHSTAGVTKKLLHNWTGPFRIVKVLRPGFYLIRDPTAPSGTAVSFTVETVSFPKNSPAGRGAGRRGRRGAGGQTTAGSVGTTNVDPTRAPANVDLWYAPPGETESLLPFMREHPDAGSHDHCSGMTHNGRPVHPEADDGVACSREASADNPLICCGSCEMAFHFDCAFYRHTPPPMQRAPKKGWFCVICWDEARGNRRRHLHPDRILESRLRPRFFHGTAVVEYRVRYRGQPEDIRGWERAEKLSPALVDAYEAHCLRRGIDAPRAGGTRDSVAEGRREQPVGARGGLRSSRRQQSYQAAAAAARRR
jgi:transposase InsO family protein